MIILTERIADALLLQLQETNLFHYKVGKGTLKLNY